MLLFNAYEIIVLIKLNKYFFKKDNKEIKDEMEPLLKDFKN